MRKIFALFRNPASYIDPLLQIFAQKTELFVAFSVNKPHKENSLAGVDHIFLKHAEQEKFREGKDYEIIQKDVKQHIKQENYELVFLATSYWSPTTWLALHQAKKKKLPVMTRMTAIVEKKRNIIIQIIKKIVVTLYCSKMDAGIYECEEQKNYMLKYGMSENQLFFAPCAVNNDFFAAKKDKYSKALCRKEFGIDDDTLAIVFTGQLIQRKRPLDIFNAVKKLKDNGYKVCLFVLGEGPLERELTTYIKSNLLDNEIILCSKVDHETMSKYLSAGDLYVLPSEYDASPKALNEAMNFELPIVISNGIKTAKEMCEIGENGFVYSVGDIEALTDCIRKLADNRELVEKMGKKSREIVSRYSFDLVVDTWLNAIEYCISKKEIN